MKTKTRRVLALVGSAFLLVVMTIGATVAYLSDTKTVNNTFSVGHVNILLDEADVYEFGAKDIPEGKAHGQAIEGAKRVTDGNEYKLFPGHTYDKDPTVTVEKDSEDCYVRALVTVNKKSALDKLFADHNITDVSTVVTGTDLTKWELEGVTYGSDSIVYEVRYKNVVKSSTSNTELEPVFTTIKVPGILNNDEIAQLEGMKINVVAQAIQADGFDDADAAWAAFEGKISDSNT